MIPLTSPLTVSVATLAAGEGAPGAVVPISWRRRPGRGVARAGRRRIPCPARPRRALPPDDETTPRTTATGRIPGSRDQRTRSGGEPPARRRRLRGARPVAPPRARPRAPSRADAAHAARDAIRSAGAPRRRRRRVRRVLAVRRARAARGGPGNATRAHSGRALLTDGLRWLRAHGARRAYVNTQEDNDRALALYVGSGFEQLPVGLNVLGREL